MARKKRAAPVDPPEPDPGLVPLSWHTERRRVRDLVPWQGNPRRLSPRQRAQLEESLTKFNLVEIPAANVDGGLIAGHQRCELLVAAGRGDEEIDVRIPSRPLTSEEAAEYNVRSNKDTGEWDWEKLGEMAPDLLVTAGFTEAELAANLPGAGPTEADMAEDNEKIAGFMKRKQQSKERMADGQEVNTWLCLVFQSYEQKWEFLEALGQPETVFGMYVDGQALAEKLGLKITKNTQKPLTSPLDHQLTELAE